MRYSTFSSQSVITKLAVNTPNVYTPDLIATTLRRESTSRSEPIGSRVPWFCGTTGSPLIQQSPTLILNRMDDATGLESRVKQKSLR